MSKVFIVNRSPHDFSPAEKWGELIFMSEGSMNRYAVNNMARVFAEKMRGSGPDDYLIPCSLNSMNVIAAGIFAAKHKRLNLLLYKNGDYLERNMVFE